MIKEAFPTSQYTSIQDIMKFILALEVRLFDLVETISPTLPQSRFTIVDDIPSMGPFFFLDPDLSSEEARSMTKSFADSDRRKSLRGTLSHLLLTNLSSANAGARFSSVTRTT